MIKPICSVIIPVGPRHAQHCRVAAASALQQSIGRNTVEVIVAPDGSADVAPMAGVTVLESDGERRGPAHTRNRGIAQAAGSFITFLDADDYLQPRGLEHMLRAYATGRYGYIYGNCFTVEQDGSYVLRGAPDYVQKDMAHYNIHVITTLIPTHIVKRLGGLDERIDAWEDWAWHLKLAIAGICGYRVDEPVFVYRVFEGDRMTVFNRDRSTMEPVWKLYRNTQGVIEMASCCGGDATLAQLAGLGVQGVAAPPARGVGDGMVRVKYVGDDRNSIPFDFGVGEPIRLGANAMHRYANVTVQQAAWLAERIPVIVVPEADPPSLPPEALPEVVRPEQNAHALRPARRAQANAVARVVDRVTIYLPPECVICGDRAITTAGHYPVCGKHYNAYQAEGRKNLPDNQRVVWQQIQRAGERQ